MTCFLFSLLAFANAQTEICDNALDDDNDGLIDLNDGDCECETIKPVSLIPNPSFEEMTCCPNGFGELGCIQNWETPTETTGDYLHHCGFLGFDVVPPPEPFPNGDGIIGLQDFSYPGPDGTITTWKEYAAICLTQPLLADSIYQIQFELGFGVDLFSPKIVIEIYGAYSCDELLKNYDGNRSCPDVDLGWHTLGAVEVSSGNGDKWVKSNITFTDKKSIAAIAIGPACSRNDTTYNDYYFFDNLILSGIEEFGSEIIEISQPCADDFTLAIVEKANRFYQWYKDGIALTNETKAKLSKIYGEGIYQVTVLENGICNLSQAYNYIKPTEWSEVARTICQGDFYQFGNKKLTESGIYQDTLKTRFNCDSIVSLTLGISGEVLDTIRGEIFLGETFNLGNKKFDKKGEYIVSVVSSQGCEIDVLLMLDVFGVFIPNIFSPNQDGFNDTFTIIGEADQFQVQEFKIYDRLGNMVFSGYEWDGTWKGSPIAEGVYTYFLRLKIGNGKTELKTGSITLIR
ncbi:gliding motility-associated C-terminal domain-containing protein [Portibacter lacus]|uniref:gliding motility-associated C-terminal domain-containing protein n=1 Tax=Portibacter lacus TaxID=1099794 RepID=UPI001F360E57|nr:gliding motility-associated C-terminal domain-containing protein [Portibacter lacus]